MKKWPAPVLKLLASKLKSAELIATASNSVEKCEADFYVVSKDFPRPLRRRDWRFRAISPK
ncbi:hypothetical protein P9272_29750 [Mesorhizobium sp. WSM4976]|uniref:hypothetical protein n=1 Tax=Mesorhizobium sp. WSM4976 TaxID=3038549 RepID=UPI0024162210|nr:hypothetical protein [Mesorhizobium sp. WSM4976]MDG4897727.1 hypothetical protein [Mesorhizobium sp. WSM4976]